MIFENKKKATLILADGTEFEGRAFGADGSVVGEIVFTTAMVGYQETLTDPSYCGQIVTQTFPLIGNYGVNSVDPESNGSVVSGYIVREQCEDPSNFRCEGDLDSYLKKYNIIGIYDIDTRHLTKIIRESGVMNGAIVHGDFDKEALLAQIRAYNVGKVVPKVSVKAKEYYPAENAKFNVVLMDYGYKFNIRRELVKRGCNVTVMPWNSTADEIKALNPDGIMLSNGPGDPADNTEAIQTLRELIPAQIPTFGICLGHQCIGEAFGGTVSYAKTLFHGKQSEVTHCLDGVFTGIDTPVKVARYHSLAVLRDDLPECLKVTAQTADGEIMAMRHKEYPVVGLQFHPESIYTEHGKRMIENFLSGVI